MPVISLVVRSLYKLLICSLRMVGCILISFQFSDLVIQIFKLSFYESPDFLDGYWDMSLSVDNFISLDLLSLLVNLATDLSILLFSSKNQFFISLILCPICYYFYVITSSPSLINLCSLLPWLLVLDISGILLTCRYAISWFFLM